ncbi:unnamed protein product [Dicrocoelium dendriticum]|nr:unnamed protein product [Dicrocoelium dendriticum]
MQPINLLQLPYFNLTEQPLNIPITAAVISGPIPEKFCQEVGKQTGYVTQSCTSMGKSQKSSTHIRNGVIHLRRQTSFYPFDLPGYMIELAELVNRMNQQHGKCEFNGYIQLTRDHPIKKTNIHTPQQRQV